MPAHTCFAVTTYPAKTGVPTVPQHPYSSDVAPTDFFLFKLLKIQHFGTVDDVKQACTKALKGISEEDNHDAFDAWTF